MLLCVVDRKSEMGRSSKNLRNEIYKVVIGYIWLERESRDFKTEILFVQNNSDVNRTFYNSVNSTR